jgi:uncharacterized Fe-S cluster protein YjdI
MDKIREYKKDDLTVVWKQDLCIHSEKCFHGLKDVFNPNQRPWINLEAATKDVILAQVKKCPSGALSYQLEGELNQEKESNMKVEVNATGPLIVTGDFTIQHADGKEETRTGKTTLCRCGASENKPFCDGSHKKIEFKG